MKTVETNIHSSLGAVALFTGFTNGAGRIWLDNVQCRGTERRLIDCNANALGSHNCQHFEDAGVRCQAGMYAKSSLLSFLLWLTLCISFEVTYSSSKKLSFCLVFCRLWAK